MFSEKLTLVCSDHKVVQTAAFQEAIFKGFDNLITHAADRYTYIYLQFFKANEIMASFKP